MILDRFRQRASDKAAGPGDRDDSIACCHRFSSPSNSAVNWWIIILPMIGARGALERAYDTARYPATVEVTLLGLDAFAIHKAENAAGVEGNTTIDLAEAFAWVLVTPGHHSRCGVRCQSPIGGLSFPLTVTAVRGFDKLCPIDVGTWEVIGGRAGSFQDTPTRMTADDGVIARLYLYRCLTVNEYRRPRIIPDRFLPRAGFFCKFGALFADVVPHG